MERLKEMEDDSIYNMSQSRGYSVPPPLPKTCDAQPSELYQIVMRHSHYPPILQTSSWTLAVPFKEQHLHRTPSECIGSNYSPRAQALKLVNLRTGDTLSANPRQNRQGLHIFHLEGNKQLHQGKGIDLLILHSHLGQGLHQEAFAFPAAGL
ncbi:Dynein heavy chain 3, axonemal Axonemal beta dynein heavy chain 3 [Larimichthys crocea]|uniref:Dynein heavy chain 3, axonemal Axonemal beta dynein heavy chain 3 n=1 Tax=Larimichthys crocea TaxID=215358 RepID=A0A6G0HST5_LARCR|nr:Dynein heavy chain 3, axonemal Axonemal beta dynein heavy chain 3 [Larimichthys crocea]